MEERITALEIKLAYLEKFCTELDDVVRGLNDNFDILKREVQRLRQVEERNGRGAMSPNEKPPHY